MLTLIIRTDKPEAEIGLYDGDKKINYYSWPAHRQLAETIHLKIKELLDKNGKNLNNLEAIAVYKGPGSFTGLRIGLSVANALAQGLAIPIVGSENESWLSEALTKLQRGENNNLVIPAYGSLPNITKPKH
jgi:tRNA threonylcarbamoyladenosine biosynthesis protein TsaB